MEKEAGFTFVELVTVLAVIAALTAITIPGFLAIIPNYRLNAASQEMLGDIQLAKLRAIKEGQAVAVSVSAATDTYTIFIDNGAGANYGNGVNDGDEAAPFKSVTMPEGVDITGTTLTANAVRFNSRGFPVNWSIGQVNIQNSRGRTVSIALSMSGLAQLN